VFNAKENLQGIVSAEQARTFAPIIPYFTAEQLQVLKYRPTVIVSYVMQRECPGKFTVIPGACQRQWI
jgi:hypothetical protein